MAPAKSASNPILRLWSTAPEALWMAGVCLLFLVLTGAAFAPALGGQRFPFGSDTVTHDYILHHWGWRTVMVGRGEWPLWTPHLFSGLPFLASFSLCPFYPTGWLQFVLPMPVAFTLQYVLAIVVGGAGMVRLARVLGAGRILALIAGLAFMASGHFLTLIHAGHLQKMIAVAWSPWVLAAALGLGRHGIRSRTNGEDRLVALLGQPGPWLLLTVSLSMQLLASHAQIFYGSVLLALLVVVPWHLLRLRRLSAHGWACLAQVMVGGFRVAMAAALAMAFAAGQMFPALELAPLSNRGAGVPYEEAVATSYPPLELLEYAIPSVFGDSIRGSAVPYFGGWGERIVSDFLGLGILGLAALGWWSLRRRGPGGSIRDRRLAILLAVAVGLSIIVGLGRHTPLYVALWAVLPGFGSFRSPGSFMFVANLGLLALAVVGARTVLTGLGGRAASLNRGAYFGALGLGAVLVLWAVYENIGFRLELATQAEARRWKIFQGMGLFGAQLLAVAVLLRMALNSNSQRRRATLLSVLGVATLGLMLTSNGRYVRFEPLAPYLAYLNQESWRASSRPNTPHSPMPGEWPRILEQNDLLIGALIHDSGVPLGYHPLSLARYEVLRDLVPHNTEAFASLFAINYARTSSEDPPPVAAGQFQRVVRQSAPTPAYLWRRTDPFPPLREGVTVRAAADVQDAAALITEGAANGNMRMQVVVVAEDLVRVPALQEGPQIAPGAQLSWDGPHRGRIRLAARPAEPVVLPLALPYAPGWQARDLAGNPLPLIPADLAATAIVLPQGNTGATLHYSPYSFRLGLFVMLLSLGLVLMVVGRRIAPGE